MLQYGGGRDCAAPPAARGLTVTEDGDDHPASASIKRATNGSPLITSANYAQDRVDRAGRERPRPRRYGGRHARPVVGAEPARSRSSSADRWWSPLQYSGTVPIDAKYGGAFTLLVEMPNSKSWMKLLGRRDRPANGVCDRCARHAPGARRVSRGCGTSGTENDTYGAIRNATDGMAFTQVDRPSAARRQHVEGRDRQRRANCRPYEVASPARSAAKGWGHLVGSTAAVAFASKDSAVPWHAHGQLQRPGPGHLQLLPSRRRHGASPARSISTSSPRRSPSARRRRRRRWCNPPTVTVK